MEANVFCKEKDVLQTPRTCLLSFLSFFFNEGRLSLTLQLSYGRGQVHKDDMGFADFILSVEAAVSLWPLTSRCKRQTDLHFAA